MSNIQHGISNIQIRKLVIGCWLLVIHLFPFVPVTRIVFPSSLDIPCWIFSFAPSSLDIGYWTLDVGYSVLLLLPWILVIGHWIFGFAPSSLNIGYSSFSLFFFAVATLLNNIEINSSVSFRSGESCSDGLINSVRTMIFSQISVSRSSFSAILSL